MLKLDLCPKIAPISNIAGEVINNKLHIYELDIPFDINEKSSDDIHKNIIKTIAVIEFNRRESINNFKSLLNSIIL